MSQPALGSHALPSAERILLQRDPYIREDAREAIDGSKDPGIWPCSWIRPVAEQPAPFVHAYRRVFAVEGETTARVHVSADERYQLFLDGEPIGRGPERGDPQHWCFETYELKLARGEHVLAARVWSQGSERAFAQMSVASGFLLSPQSPEHQKLFGTGLSEWEVKRLEGYSFINPMAAWGTGENIVLDGSLLDAHFAMPGGKGWDKTVSTFPGLSLDFTREQEGNRHVLMPALLPPMLERERFIGTVRHVSILKEEKLTAKLPILKADHQEGEAASWQALLDSQIPLTIPPHTSRRVLIDLDNYYCAYPHLVVSGGKFSAIRINWQEALYNSDGGKFGTKGNRDEIYDKHFITLWWGKDGLGDTFKPGGDPHRVYESLWWHAGRYVEVVVTTEEEPVTLERLSFLETRYPMEAESSFKTSDPEMNGLIPILFRSLQMCSHETYMDCPYYEQLAYIGDARIEALVTFTSILDSHLPRKTLLIFDFSRMPSGLTQSRYSSKTRQMIPTFTLWWICMVYDYALWRGEPNFIRSLMPGVRIALDAFRSYEHTSGLVGAPPGWNFVDWMPQWPDGVPPDGAHGVSAAINWQVILAAKCAAALEDWLGEPELAARNNRWVAKLSKAVEKHFWDEKRGLYADDLSHRNFSMHTQILALLSGEIAPARAAKQLVPSLAKSSGLPEPTIYFRHYLFEALHSQNQGQEILPHLDLWFQLRKQGFKTTFETDPPETTRSDCHAWASSPLYHYYASIVGIRPGGFGFDSIVVRPALAKLGWAEGEMPHPRGTIRFRLEEDSTSLKGWFEIPAGTKGTIHFGGQQQELAGKTPVSLTRTN